LAAQQREYVSAGVAFAQSAKKFGLEKRRDLIKTPAISKSLGQILHSVDDGTTDV
jgi:hypothetical protein